MPASHTSLRLQGVCRSGRKIAGVRRWRQRSSIFQTQQGRYTYVKSQGWWQPHKTCTNSHQTKPQPGRREVGMKIHHQIRREWAGIAAGRTNFLQWSDSKGINHTPEHVSCSGIVTQHKLHSMSVCSERESDKTWSLPGREVRRLGEVGRGRWIWTKYMKFAKSKQNTILKKPTTISVGGGSLF